MASLLNPCKWGLDPKPCYSQAMENNILCEQHEKILGELLEWNVLDPKEIVRGEHA